MTGRPRKNQERLFKERKRLISNSISKGFNQSEVADIFRVPRNTIKDILKKLSTSDKLVK